MSKEKIENGVTIDNRVRITSDLVNSNRVLHLLIQTGISYFGVLAILYSWIIGMNLYMNQRNFLLATLFTVVVFTCIQELPKARVWIGLGYLVVLAGIGHYNWEYLENGFYCMENAFIKYASEYYNLKPFRYMVYVDPYKATTFILIVIAQMVAFIVTVEVYKHYMRSIYMFLIFLFYGTLLAMGITPNGFWFIVLIIVYMSMRTMDRIPNGIHRRFAYRNETLEVSMAGKQRLRLHSAVTISGVFLLAFLLVRLVVSPYFYDKNVNMAETKKDLQKSIREFSVSKTVNDIKDKWNEINPFTTPKSNYSGGLDSGKIGDVGSISFTGDVALTLAMDSDISYLYLKGFSGSVYKGDEWAQLSEEDMERYQAIEDEFDGSFHAETLLYDWLDQVNTVGIRQISDQLPERTPKISIDRKDIYVNYEHANLKFLYAPYSCNYLGLGELNYIGDSYVRPMSEERSNYLFTDNYICYDSDTSLNDFVYAVDYVNENFEIDTPYTLTEFKKFELEYRDFVHDVYTQLPADGLDQLKSLDLDIEDPNNTYEAITKVIKYLRTNTSYSLSPGVPSTNQDFAEYFLFDAKKGFCSHYATAAVLLLRNYGIPARYIEGYVVTKEDILEGRLNLQEQVTSTLAKVRDYNAHAWIEVYFDGAGWVPVEVTNGYSEDGVSNLIPEIEGKEDEITPTNTIIPTATPTTSPKVTEQPTTTPRPTYAPTKTPVPEENQSNVSRVAISLGIIVLALIGVVIAVLMRYQIRKINLRQFLTKGSPKHCAIANYLAIESILRELNIIKTKAQTYEEFANQASIQCELLPERFEEIVSLALKANFSKEDISEQEAMMICNYYQRFRSNYSESLPKRKKLLLKFWKVL